MQLSWLTGVEGVLPLSRLHLLLGNEAYVHSILSKQWRERNKLADPASGSTGAFDPSQALWRWIEFQQGFWKRVYETQHMSWTMFFRGPHLCKTDP